MILIRGVEVFAPERIGRRDVVVGGEKVVALGEPPLRTGDLAVTVINGEGKYLIPGLIDGHVHICGGGGEGGFHMRTPELEVAEMIRSGVTTVIGCLGTDGIARTMENLVAKAYALRGEGVSAWCYTGSYQVPVRTLTGDIMKDLMLVDPIIGVGEIALNDHRSSSPSTAELARIASEARVAGILSGKAGVTHCHMGDGPFDLMQIQEVLDRYVIPIGQFYPTHMNRNQRLLQKGIAFARKGGMVDLTTTPQSLTEGEISAAEGLYRLMKGGAAADRVTFTSDGQGLLPEYRPTGEPAGAAVGSLTSLMEAVREAVWTWQIPLEQALAPVTSTPAGYLKLKGKGRIAEGMDADLVVLDPDGLKVRDVIVRGRIGMRDGILLPQGPIEIGR